MTAPLTLISISKWKLREIKDNSYNRFCRYSNISYLMIQRLYFSGMLVLYKKKQKH